MNRNELAEFFGKSTETIRRVSKKIGIKLENGIEKDYNKDEVEQIALEMYNKNIPLAVKNAIDMTYTKVIGQPTTNVQVDQFAEMKDIMLSMMEMMKMQLQISLNKPPLQPQLPMLELKQDYYSLIGYLRMKGVKRVDFSEAITYAKACGKLSRDKGVEIRKVPDERFGKVNSYRIDILDEMLVDYLEYKLTENI